MAIHVVVPYQKTFPSSQNLEKTFAYFADVEKAVPGNFPGVESFESVGPETFRWIFEKLGYSGYEVQIQLITRFAKTAPHRVEAIAVPQAGLCLFNGSWSFEAKGTGTQVQFQAKFEIDLPIPGFLKGMATPLATKELTKLFDRYTERVEKNLG
jgi:carbon monoxide dehydrogenase subunit G